MSAGWWTRYRDLGVLENTLIYYIIGDNGASAEGTLNGCFNEMTTLNGMPGIETPEFLLSKIDDFGTPKAYNHYAVGWAHALCAPYQWTKQVASHWGGTRNGMIVHWPEGVKGKGETRSQFHHVIDVAKTILDVAGLPEPTFVNGISQAPFEGVSMAPTFNDAKAPETHTVQYFEMMGNRGIYHEGWTAVTKHRTPWKADAPPPFDDDVWELYGPDDWTQSNNLAAENPKKLAELQRLWLIEAVKYNVVPLDDRGFERINPDIAGRPQLIRGNTQLLFPGMRVSENCILTLKNKSYAVTSQVTVPKGGAKGVIVTQGGEAGGWTLYCHEGKLKYCYNFFGIDYFFTSPTGRSPRASIKSGWSSNTTAAAWPRAAALRSITTARRWHGSGRAQPAHGLLGRRSLRRRFGHRLAGLARLRADRERFHRQHRLGAARHRRRRPQSPDHAGGPLQDRDGEAVGSRALPGVRLRGGPATARIGAVRRASFYAKRVTSIACFSLARFRLRSKATRCDWPRLRGRYPRIRYAGFGSV